MAQPVEPSAPGEVITYRCNDGYKLIGNASIVCQGTGEWTGPLPYCVIGKYPTVLYTFYIIGKYSTIVCHHLIPYRTVAAVTILLNCVISRYPTVLCHRYVLYRTLSSVRTLLFQVFANPKGLSSFDFEQRTLYRIR